MSDNNTFTLRIEYRNGDVKFITNVSEYGILKALNMFYFDKNDNRTFIPVDVIRYFGKSKDHDV